MLLLESLHSIPHLIFGGLLCSIIAIDIINNELLLRSWLGRLVKYLIQLCSLVLPT